MKIKLLPILIACFSTQIFAAEPNSEIPDKRIFPLSTKYKPCDDFHKYVCDEAEKSFKLRDDRSRHAFAFNDSSERILEAKKKFFAQINQEKKMTARGKQVKDYYLACMNEEAGKAQENLYLQKLVKSTTDVKSAEQFMKLQIDNIEKGEPSIVWFGAHSNHDNPEVNDIIVLSELMNLPEHTYYDNKDLMVEYKKLVADFFKIVEPSLPQAELDAKADRMIAFEKEFVKIYPHPEVRRQRWSEKRQQSQTEFTQKYPKIPMATLFKRTPKKAIVFNAIPESFEFINQKADADHLNVLKDFFLYSTGSGLLDDSNPDYFKKAFAFRHKYLGGPVSRSERDERCTREVMGAFPKELDQILISRLFPNFP